MWAEIDPSALAAFGQVIIIDLVLAGDNAIVVGMAARGLEPTLRWRVICIGVAGAILFRILFALVATQLLQIVGLVLAGGLLLLWVAWKLWREMRNGTSLEGEAAGDNPAPEAPVKSFKSAVWQIIVADVSMSLDNVLAVAGAARDHVSMLIFGLVLSVALMGVAAGYIARIMGRYPWITYVGLLIIVYVALSMIYEGARDLFEVMAA